MKPYIYLTLFCLPFAAKAQKLNIPNGHTFEIATHNKQGGTFKDDQKFTYAFKSLGKDKAGNNILEAKLVNISIYDFYAKKTLLNTDSIKNTGFYTTAVIGPLAMLNKPFTVTMSPKGEVVSITGAKEALQAGLKAWDVEDDITKQQLANQESGLRQTIADMFYTGSSDAKTATPKRGPEAKTTDAPFKQISTTANTVTMQSTIKNDSTKFVKRYVLDAKTGLVQSALKKQDTKYKVGPEANVKGNVMDIQVENTQTLSAPKVRRPIDTAWMNMAVRMSSWSNSLKKGTAPDSAKIYKMAKNMDQRLANDPYYVKAVLSAVQSIRGNHGYKVYDSLLVNTPDKFIEGDRIHLHNKLSSALEKKGPQYAYQTTLHASKTEAFESWVDHSFSQGFTDWDAEDIDDRVAYDRRKKDHYELLRLGMATKDPKYTEVIRPLSLWATAKKQSNDAALLSRTADEFAKMTDKEILAGNGSRYALLVYQLLAKTTDTAKSNAYLANTIARLQRYADDTTNTRRYADQNMLAGAYYLKYLAQEKAGDASAVKSLAIAAKYSPRSPKEKAYTSFYDRVFLKTKESYRELFIEKLLKSGNEDEALAMFAEHVNAMPENIEETKKLYTQKFPDRDFKKFFTDKIMTQWAIAPDFAMKGWDGKPYALADHKGKWLVLDFWGTWCGPCREELPVVNKFSTEVAEGKYPNVDFLSISCYDTDKKVKDFLEENKYSLPVAMSDGKVQGNYKISGYPSKIIISPEGKMIKVDFGKDWRGVIKSFSAM
ncbi:redoxin domain-containing protein [Mucilaginibacter myungsuensis]|uniref:TlpA family protein disulfide reductase n=1 Tax=Mucilaginibacter myungsuensis TaxID=649104 RepID=A0A929KUF8_9SPHI|nr:redoxin domain-containing protein [Mucilaginibacter myungsuensis]MBE9660640.1 TlpA family protein disulfide reductase [Mucilaginibacter myungsuensis]MDN3600685.1 redoxin domain-containing protein [Mucilaginibacter myungsuensis]